ncbi:MAG: PIN domain-containing protein [Anaerolineales bacterium]|jgi:predicted nucleic acid-binding protein
MSTEKLAKTRFRAVLNTNVYISIFTSPKGELGTIWEQALKGTYTLLISPAIVAEIAGVLREKFQWPEEAIKARVKRFARIAEIVTPETVPSVIKNDPP